MKKKEEEALIHRKTVSATGSTVYCITHKEGVQLRLIAQTQVLGLLQFPCNYILRKLNLNYGKGYQKILII